MSGDEGELRVAWQHHVGSGPTADEWFDAVLAHHRDAARHHHDVRHVAWVVRHVRALANLDPALTESELDRAVAAAFFHDVVYDATRDDNEAVSAGVARRALVLIGWEPAAVDHVAAIIAATAGHADDPHDDDPAEPDERAGTDRCTDVVLAADLGVLAAAPGAYDDYVRNVRKEYGHLDDTTWRRGRETFVRAMLAKRAIFPAGLRLDRWERRARANLTAELAALR